MAKTVAAPTIAPMVPLRSALGDPGDWFCDFCGLCSEFTYPRANSHRLDTPHILHALLSFRRGQHWSVPARSMLMAEEAITKGIVHFGDPIIDILRLGDKRAKALKKKAAPGSHCACFGPHHGTRCHQVGVGVNGTLWERYVAAQEAILERLRATMREYLYVLADDSERPAPAARALRAPPLGQDGNATDVAKKEGSHQRG